MSPADRRATVAQAACEEARVWRSLSPRRVTVREGYDLWAACYDAQPNPLLALEERTLEALLPRLDGKIVLDVGCGTGRWLGKLLARGALAFGFDCSEGMLAHANEKPALRGRLVRCNALAMPVRNGVADVVICSLVAGYLDDLATFVSEMSQVLQPRGRLFLTDLHSQGLKLGWRRTFRVGGQTLEIENKVRSVGKVRAAFESHGFKLRRLLEASFGEPEMPIFARAGKGALFQGAASVPAIYNCEFYFSPASRKERPKR